MWCWRRTGKIIWTDRVRNEEVLQRDKWKRIIVYTVNRRKGNWTGQILCRKCLLKHVISGNSEEMIEVMGIRGRRCKQLLDDRQEKRGKLKLSKEAPDRTVERNLFG